MEIRDIAYNAVGTLDCEVNHPDYGWIPFTADPLDVEEYGKAIYAAAVALGPAPYIAPPPLDPAIALAQARASMPPISPLQGILTLGETAWGKVLAYRETASWREKVIIDNASDWVRTSENIAFFGYLLEYSDKQMDALFIAAAKVKA
jgi:hypothetical protein